MIRPMPLHRHGGLGRRFSPDQRDHGFLMRRMLPVGEPMPVRKTWKISPTALDQGQTGACVGHGWANFLRCAPIRTQKDIDAMRWAIYDAAIKLDEWTDNDNDTARQDGTSVRAGAMAVTNMGRLKSYLWAFNAQTAIDWILSAGPVVVGFNWYDSFDHPDDEGIVKLTPTAQVEGGHCFLVRGADTRRGLVRCSNSWGDSWGKSGEFWMPDDVFERLIHEDGETCTAVEQKLVSKPFTPAPA